MKIHTHVHILTQFYRQTYKFNIYIYIYTYEIYLYLHIYLYKHIVYIHTNIYTHIKKNVTVYFLRKCLGGPDLK